MHLKVVKDSRTTVFGRGRGLWAEIIQVDDNVRLKEYGNETLDNMLDWMLEKVIPVGSHIIRGLWYL